MAHALHASAHFLQWSLWLACVSHSAAQALHAITHNLQSASAYTEPLAHNLAQSSQMSAQSRQRLAHLAWAASPKLIQDVAHFSHSVVQARHALTHSSMFILWIFNLPELAEQRWLQPLHKCYTILKTIGKIYSSSRGWRCLSLSCLKWVGVSPVTFLNCLLR